MVILLGSGRCTVLKSCGGVTANDMPVCCVSTVNSAPAPPYAADAVQ